MAIATLTMSTFVTVSLFRCPCRQVSEIPDWDRRQYGKSNLCLNDHKREKLRVDRPFCFVKESLDTYVKRFCRSAPLCTLNPDHHILTSSTEVRMESDA